MKQVTNYIPKRWDRNKGLKEDLYIHMILDLGEGPFKVKTPYSKLFNTTLRPLHEDVYYLNEQSVTKEEFELGYQKRLDDFNG